MPIPKRLLRRKKPKPKRKTLPERIREAFVPDEDGYMRYPDLAWAVYPDDRSHRYQQNGGPPGCYMTLSAGLRRMGAWWGEREGKLGVWVKLPDEE